MIDYMRVFNLNNRQFLYTRMRSDKTNNLSEKVLYEISGNKGLNKPTNVAPVIKVTRSDEGDFFSYENLKSFDSVTAKRTRGNDAFTVAMPTKDEKLVIGYIKDNMPVSWTRNGSAVKLLKKIGNIVSKGL